MKRGSIALAAAVVLTGATLATASASGGTKTAVPAATAVTKVSLLLPDAPGAVSTAAFSYSGGISAAGGKAAFADLSVMRGVDSRSVLLQQRVADQKVLAKGVALVVSQTGRTQPVMKVTLGGATAVADSFSGSSGGSSAESVSFHYTAIEVEYWTPASGGGYTLAKSCWNTATQTESCPAAVN